VSFASLQLIKKEGTEGSELSHSIKKKIGMAKKKSWLQFLSSKIFMKGKLGGRAHFNRNPSR
tara:strand:- start:333 stop:518 length:186 start_codon:yes stop_codon:yes gene_type:complete